MNAGRERLPGVFQGSREMSKERQSRLGGRDNRTGKFVPLKETERRPDSTARERIPLPGYGDTGRYDDDKKKGG